jgi:D-alanine-D-alanine ligase
LLSLRKKPDLLRPTALPNLSVLYAARHAPASEQVRSVTPDDGGYPYYHVEIYNQLLELGLRVTAINEISAVEALIPRHDYVFSLFNRIGFEGGEVFVSAMCEYYGVPFMGGPPHLRAIAEDKHLAKLVATEAGLSTPSWRAYRTGETPEEEPPFDGPFMVKPRYGAGSENIASDSKLSHWSDVLSKIAEFNDLGISTLVETYVDGWNLTVPVLGGASPYVLPSVTSRVEEDDQVLTHLHKLGKTGSLHFDVVDPEPVWARQARQIGAFLERIQPFDYLRADYRIDRKTYTPYFLEFNICCDISSSGSLMAAARHAGLSHLEVLAHVVCYSWGRQASAATGGSAKSPRE